MYNIKDKTDGSRTENKGFHALVLVALATSAYRDPEKIAHILLRYREVKSAHIVAGNWELILHIRTKDQNKFYEFLKKATSEENGITKVSSIISLKQVKQNSS